ncbi:MAG TPA: hypothetical protein VH186_15595 [Chloroflexia bacterium]|nr:hypothetical protein [Chloroflexia bacterium]
MTNLPGKALDARIFLKIYPAILNEEASEQALKNYAIQNLRFYSDFDSVPIFFDITQVSNSRLKPHSLILTKIPLLATPVTARSNLTGSKILIIPNFLVAFSNYGKTDRKNAYNVYPAAYKATSRPVNEIINNPHKAVSLEEHQKKLAAVTIIATLPGEKLYKPLDPIKITVLNVPFRGKARNFVEFNSARAWTARNLYAEENKFIPERIMENSGRLLRVIRSTMGGRRCWSGRASVRTCSLNGGRANYILRAVSTAFVNYKKIRVSFNYADFYFLER